MLNSMVSKYNLIQKLSKDAMLNTMSLSLSLPLPLPLPLSLSLSLSLMVDTMC